MERRDGGRSVGKSSDQSSDASTFNPDESRDGMLGWVPKAVRGRAKLNVASLPTTRMKALRRVSWKMRRATIMDHRLET